MNSIDIVKAKATLFRVLKVLTYLTGFPLLLYFAKSDAAVLKTIGITAASADTAYNVLFMCFIAVAAAQIAVGFAMRKTGFVTRSLVAAAVAVAAVLTPVLYVENGVKAEFDKMQEKYAGSGYDFARYEKQVSDFAGRANGYESALGGFMSAYNLSGEDGYSDGNLDKTPTAGKDGNIFLKGFGGFEHYTFGVNAGNAVYSMNGLYSDGYVFGFNQAKYILTTYHKTADLYKAEGLDVETELQKALSDLDLDGSVWKDYQKTEEYLRAYGDSAVDKDAKIEIDGKEYDLYKLRADNYYLTKDEVKTMVDKLFAELSENEAMGELVALIKGAAGLLGLEIPKELTDVLDDYKNLGYDGLIAAIEALNVEIGGKTLNEETLLGLISDFSFYQAPSSYPKMFFIADETLREYAYAKYLATKHGAVVGSVLIGDSVGKVTLDAAGNFPMAKNELASLFQRLEIESEFMPKYYPWLAVRANLIKYGGMAPVALIFAYFFAYAEKKQTDKITVKEGVL
ncbi:MAG: hypothetical protein LBP62_01440 [Clostridiales bacterium]|jgi:NADH:ubiquinone oxidoreductase subunit K|nr:hypothetical protein [Clostridiales bacterium]